MRKVCKISIISFLVIACLSSCRPDHVDLVETTIPTIEKKSDGKIVSKEKVVTPTIDLEKIIIESVEESIEKKNEEESKKASETSVIASETLEESNIVAESSTVAETKESLPLFDQMFEEDDRVYHGTEKVETDNWRYGMTPCEWIYVEPGIQLISNYKPNTSKQFPANAGTRVSSGVKGCFVPVFTKCDMMSNDYEGRLYVFSDYSKAVPEEITFNNSLKTVTYKALSIEEILRMAFDVERTQNGLLIINGEYVNIVYVTDLDKILNGT